MLRLLLLPLLLLYLVVLLLLLLLLYLLLLLLLLLLWLVVVLCLTKKGSGHALGWTLLSCLHFARQHSPYQVCDSRWLHCEFATR